MDLLACQKAIAASTSKATRLYNKHTEDYARTHNPRGQR